jgi:hypothetical protein
VNQVCQGTATIVERAPGHYVLSIDTDGTTYCNAQLDDYHHLPRMSYPWRAPIKLSLDARLTGDARGTWGFGFWNAPYSPLASRWPTLPATAWFFGNGSGNLSWDIDSAPTGFKAATLDTRRMHARLLAPFAPLLLLLMRSAAVYRTVWPRLTRWLGLSERMLAKDSAWHHYELQWQPDCTIWLVDGIVVHQTSCSPHAPLGLCMWVDNQWLVAGPRSGFGWGVGPSQTTLEIRELTISNF